MNDAERLLRGRHIVDLAGDFEKIDYAIERIHDLLARSYYNLRKLIEHHGDEAKLAELRPLFDRHYLALRDVTSGYLRLEQAHDRLYELMGDDEVRTAEARSAAAQQRREREQTKRDQAEERMRRGYRPTHLTPSTMLAVPADDDVDSTDIAASASDALEASIATTEMMHTSVDPTKARKGLSGHFNAIKGAEKRQRSKASAGSSTDPVDPDQSWNIPTTRVTAEHIAAIMKDLKSE